MRSRLVLLSLLALASPALATSVRETSIAERAALSDLVIRAEVISTETKVPDSGDMRRMTTWTKVTVLDVIKGTAPKTLQILQLGGKSGLWEAHIPGDATFEPHERALLFLRCRDKAHPDVCTLVSFKEGKLRQIGADELVEESFTHAAAKRSLKDVVAQVKASRK